MNDDLHGDYSYSYENTTNTKYKIQAKLKPFTYYKFQVFAVNLLGENKRSSSIRVRTAASSNGFLFFKRYNLNILLNRTWICQIHSLYTSRKFNIYD
jgi:hypothetical protein